MALEYGFSGKWLEFIKQIVPNMTGMLAYPLALPSSLSFRPWRRRSMSEITQVNLRDTAEIEATITSFASSPNVGLIITASGLAYIHRDRIIKLAAEHRLPAVYFERAFVEAGGLVSYGPDLIDQFRRAVGYVDRVLKGEKPADMPVQAPTKYELVINLKTAKVLGLTIPQPLLAGANELIE
jgi:putative ABC transport system substrate-binding protein